MTRLDGRLILFLFVIITLTLVFLIPRNREIMGRGSRFITVKRKTRKSKFFILTQDGKRLDGTNGIPVPVGSNRLKIRLLASDGIIVWNFLINLRIICTKDQFRIIEEQYENNNREEFHLSLNIQKTNDSIYPRLICINVYSSHDNVDWFGTSELLT